MSSKAISEFDSKKLLLKFVEPVEIIDSFQIAKVHSKSDIPNWAKNTKIVIKPDQLIKRRGKLGLVGVNLSFDEANNWHENHFGKEIKIGKNKGILENFIVEPFYEHSEKEEMYISIYPKRDGDEVLFCKNGGVNVGDVDKNAKKMFLPINGEIKMENLKKLFLDIKDENEKIFLAKFARSLFDFYSKLHFTFLEINPFVITNTKIPKIRILDVAAKIDEAAQYQNLRYFSDIVFPPPFGSKKTKEEVNVASLDAKTGASLKLTVLNPRGHVWTLVAGGGASVIYTDTILSLLKDEKELGNYGEYSGAPTKSLTFEFARIVISLMLKFDDEFGYTGKVLIVGGGVANFTNVAETFDGIIEALTKNATELRKQNVSVFVRRGGPNYQKGLEKMERAGINLKIPIFVFGPEKGMTSIVTLALKQLKLIKHPYNHFKTPKFEIKLKNNEKLHKKEENEMTFNKETKAIVYGMQVSAVQNMLDFDYLSERSPSVCCLVYTFAARSHVRQFFYGSKELFVPVYNDFSEAIKKHPEASVVVNFASSRSVFSSTLEMMSFPQIRAIGVIAEGVPERHSRQLAAEAKRKNLILIGPATVGMIKPGSFRMGNAGGKTDNILASKLFSSGSVAYVSRSGGLSNELNNIISRECDGVYEGIAIGGDRYPGSTFLDFILRFERDDNCKMIVLLGEVGGILEHEVAEALRNGQITKPVVAWCTGGSAERFPYSIQFGHAGACAGCDRETASAKNKSLKNAGAFVPDNFEQFGTLISFVFRSIPRRKRLSAAYQKTPPEMPIDFEWGRKLGLIRKTPNFVSSIVSEKNGEPTYGGVPISEVLKSGMGIGDVIGLLWFKKVLPNYVSRFFEIVLLLIADHGPAVSAAHNTIVTARAGKDVISALISGLVTIGPRFGGALDGAAKVFSWGLREKLSPAQLVDRMRSEKRLIMGIGHKKKSLENPDRRVQILVQFCRRHFRSNELLEYALRVEQITTRKKSNLILNVDGAIGVCFVDCLRSCGGFSSEEVDDYVEKGTISALFVLGRSVGLIGHFLDQNRLQQPLYRHPTDDIAFVGENREDDKSLAGFANSEEDFGNRDFGKKDFEESKKLAMGSDKDEDSVKTEINFKVRIASS